MKRKQVEEEEETARLISCKVVEYLEPVMSKELLFKFPDNSAFDFDYAQSSIWSPLVPRNYSPMDLDLVTPTKIAFGFVSELDDKNSGRSGSKKLSSSIKKKKKKMMMKKMAISKLKIRKHKVKVSEFSPTSIKTSCVPFATKGWNKVLKAATKHFKKRKMKHPRHRLSGGMALCAFCCHEFELWSCMPVSPVLPYLPAGFAGCSVDLGDSLWCA